MTEPATQETPPPAAAVFPGDAEEAAETFGADTATRRDAARHSWRVLAMLCTLMGFASISTDLYLPAMPVMGQSLGASAGMVEWTISGYLIGFSLGQLLWGPVGDRLGRRRPIAIGLVLFIIGSAGCAMAQTPWSHHFLAPRAGHRCLRQCRPRPRHGARSL